MNIPTTADWEPSDIHTGFRLHYFELLNWGTFHKHIWSLFQEGANSLLTGDIGSGKSTLVDGLTTLLISPQKIVYNKAAGADTKERNLKSYVHGYYKSKKDSHTLSAKSVALRVDDSYSVLLANFYNEAYQQAVTLAQVFWGRDHGNSLDRFYVVADKALRISDAFCGFGNNILYLKKRLQKEKGVKIFNSFAQYATEFRRRMGITGDQALKLLYQTVSMKSVGDLTDFVRRHMLEAPPVMPHIIEICRQFNDLNNAHDAVSKAKQQVGMLQPIADSYEHYCNLEVKIASLKEGRDALNPFFENKKIFLLEKRLERRKEAREKISARKNACRTRLIELRNEQRKLDRAVSASGDRRLEELSSEIERLTKERKKISDKAEAYRKYSTKLKMTFPKDEGAFIDNRNYAIRWKKKLAVQRDDLLNQQIDKKVCLNELVGKIELLEEELNSLLKRKTNIPRKSLELRRSICEALEIKEDQLPFAGELLRLKQGESAWEGVAERLLYNFALSLLVPSDHYVEVARYVDATDLNGWLVYLKTFEKSDQTLKKPVQDSLLRKLDIKPDTPFYNWLEWELSQRFNYICCDSMDEFRRRKTALTANGQIKSGGVYHEKDDRHRIDERARYILGWDNQEKIYLLQAKFHKQKWHYEDIVKEANALEAECKKIDTARDILQNILGFDTYNEIHWQPLAKQIQQLTEEKEQIEESSDVLTTLQTKLDRIIIDIQSEEDMLPKFLAQLGKVQEGIDQDDKALKMAKAVLSELSETDQERLFPILSQMQTEALGKTKVTVSNCDTNQVRMREWIQHKIDNETDKIQRNAAYIIRNMQAYKSNYPLETKEVDAAIESMDEFNQILSQLKENDLPKHEQCFKTMLNEGTIQNIALFQAKLDKELSDIRQKIEIINRSLTSIDYDDGTFISLVADPEPDVEIRQFKEDLQACLGDPLIGKEDDTYTENKFIQVKAIIDRFNGRKGQADIDKSWTQKVTDVRNWLVFSVSEKWREDDKEKEFYSDTAGKSGGQKEKLAYTILASALAYQFGLKWGEKKSRSLRFVMIDEAFGRGSDDSTRYALELFKKLNFQLLIVTPLQKINIIEDFVSSVHFIHNEDGKNSMIRNLSIEQYREEKAAYQESAA
jgi:uncharacterized protein YPO0396